MKSISPLLCLAFVMVIAQTSAAIAADEQVVSEQECEEVLSSFSITPTLRQNADSRRKLLTRIKEHQEEKYGAACEIYPRWRERFEDAYKAAYLEARFPDSNGDLVEAAPPSGYVADPECYELLEQYSRVVMTRAGGASVESIREELAGIDNETFTLGCNRDVNWQRQFSELQAAAVASGIIEGAGGAIK